MKKPVDCLILIDDDDITNSLHLMLLEDLNITDCIHVAADGEEALDLLNRLFASPEATPPGSCLIFLDINMPGLSGFELLEELHKREKEYPVDKLQVYLLTSSSSRRDIEEAERFQVAGYLDKPLTEEKIMEAVSALSK